MDINWNFILTSAVIGSVVTSTANIIISLFNNNRLKKIEKNKRKNELTTYRYTKLYEISLKWTEMNSSFETENKSPSEIASERLTNGFIDDLHKYSIISPLLDEKYKPELDDISEKGNQCLYKLIDIETKLDYKENEELREQHKEVFKSYTKFSALFSATLKKVLQEQLNELLKS